MKWKDHPNLRRRPPTPSKGAGRFSGQSSAPSPRAVPTCSQRQACAAYLFHGLFVHTSLNCDHRGMIDSFGIAKRSVISGSLAPSIGKSGTPHPATKWLAPPRGR